MKQGNNQVIAIVQKNTKKNSSTCVIVNYKHVHTSNYFLKSNVLIGSTHDIIETLETASNHATQPYF